MAPCGCCYCRLFPEGPANPGPLAVSGTPKKLLMRAGTPPLNITPGGPDPDGSIAERALHIMADNQNISATPYPFYATGGNDDDSFRAALTSHIGASVERNQDAQFSANRDLQLVRDVASGTKDAEIRALEVKADLLAEIKDHERRSVERDNAVQVQLMAIRAEHAAAESARTARELAKVEADGRNAALATVLDKILAKLP